MNPEILKRVLSCHRLPTLPHVAARIIELTSDSNVSTSQLAEAIQSDQALAARVLRTANSSLFGVRQKCSSVSQAVVMLGLDAVRMIALGFIIIEAIKGTSDPSFDLRNHWRRSLHAGVAARLIAQRVGLPNPEECFLGGLLQDFGMIALHQAMGEEYLAIIGPAGPSHRAVARLELAGLQMHHGDVGAMLASKWKLPDSLVMPIKYHERPTAAPHEHLPTCRTVGLGNAVADILGGEDATEPLAKFYKQSGQWFGLTRPQCDQILDAVITQSREVAGLLHIDAAEAQNPQALLEVARGRMAQTEVVAPIEIQACEMPGEASESVDELTGAASRMGFDRAAIAAFEQTLAGAGPLSVAIVEVCDLDGVEREFGPDARDTMLIAAAGRLSGACAGTRAMVARFAGDRFAMLLPRTDRFSAARIVASAIEAVGAEPIKLIAARQGAPAVLMATMRSGVVTVDMDEAERLGDSGEVVARAVADLGSAVAAVPEGTAKAA